MSKLSGERIKARRNELKMTQSELAAALDGGKALVEDGKSKISKYEHGANFNIDVLNRLAHALKCEPNYLLGWDEHPNSVTSDIAKEIPLDRQSIELLRELRSEIDYFQGLNLTENDSRLTAELVNVLISTVVADTDDGGSNTFILELIYRLMDAIRVTSEYEKANFDDLKKFERLMRRPPERYRMAQWEQEMYEQKLADVFKDAIHKFAEVAIICEDAHKNNGEEV